MRCPETADSSVLNGAFLPSAHGFVPQLHIEALYKHPIEAVSDSQPERSFQVEENL